MEREARPKIRRRRMLILAAWMFLSLYIVPPMISAALYFASPQRVNWRSADRSATGVLPLAARHPAALVAILSARTVMWRGILASHSWIVIKEAGASSYQRFDYTAWGQPIWVDRFVADAKWFGNAPETVYLSEGDDAARMIPRIRQAIKEYRFAKGGDYRLWPGPNSNTFVAALMQAARIKATLPPTAVGKDYPYDGRWIGLTPSGTGIRLNAGGYFGLSVGWVEGVELNLLGAVAGLDIRRPGLKLPGVGRIGI